MRSGMCVAVAGLAAAALSGGRVLAHRTVVSPFTFSRDVRPILQRRCEPCHADGGVAPMALRRYDDVRLQSWPLRQVLTSGRMPPWSGESGTAALKEQQVLSARELDVLMTWAAGGTPEGTPVAAGETALGASPPADAIVEMPQPFTLAGGAASADVEIALPSAGVEGKWIRAVGIRPGTPSIVRSAALVVKSPGREEIAGLWIPGDRPQPLEGGAAFEVPVGAALTLRMRYERPRPDDGAPPISDRSAVGFFFAEASSARRVRTLDISAVPTTVDSPVQAVALRPISGPAGARVTISVVSAGGARATLLGLQFRPEWPQRYVFAAPVSLARGSRIEARVDPGTAEPFHAALEIVR